MPNPSVKLFDTHAHFFTNDTERYPVDLSGAREGADVMMERLKNDTATAQRVFALWDETSVAGGAAVQYNTVYKTDNSYTIDVADAHRERVSAVLILAADDPATPGTLRGVATQHNVSGLRLFGYPDSDGNYPWLDSWAARATWDVVAELGLHMVLMYAPGVPSEAALQRIVALAKRYPDTAIALDHCGWPNVDQGVTGTIGPEHRKLVDVSNIHFKFTQINFNRLAAARIDSAEFVQRLVDTYGAGRVMWGSDYGNTKTAYPEMVRQAIEATRLLDDGAREQVLYTNGTRLFAGRASR